MTKASLDRFLPIQLRNQADNECRTLKHELNQAKMNLNQVKDCAEI